MIAAPFFDEKLIKDYVLNTNIFEQIFDDLHDPYKYNPDINDLWLAVYDKDGLAGVCSFSLVNSITLDIHPFFAKKTKGRKGIICCLNWLKRQTYRRVEKVVAAIPACHKSVYNCAKRIGFIDEGVCKGSFLKDGDIYDRYYLGLKLSEAEF